MAKSALKFKDSVAAYEQLAGQIAARRFVPIYLLMGEESYFIDAIAEQIATTVLGEAERAFNQLTVYGKDSEAGQVINLCRQMPMMGSYQVVILKEAQQLRGLGQALALHPEAIADDDPRNLPQGEKRRQAFGLLQGLRRQRRGARVGAPARLRDRLVAPAIHRRERVGH